MNKILNINLGGYALTIDDDAFEYLESYLQSIRRRFSESEGRDEILHDIESRIGELIHDDLRGRTIVMLPDVEAAVQVMGKPEDFGADPVESKRSGNSRSTSSIRTGKRLFRDEDDAVVGGVCSGLAAYFGIQDPVWMRLIFVLLALISLGFWAPAYILLLILVPAAKTAADRLAMRGERVNVDNIAKEIEDGFERISTRVNEFGSDAKKKSSAGGRSFGNAVAGGVSVLGRVFGLFVQFLAKFGLLIAIFVGIVLFIALVVSWMAGIWSFFKGAPYIGYFSPYSSGLTYLGVTNLFLVFGLPILGLCLLFVRVLLKVRTPRWLSGGLTLVWGLNMISLVLLSVFAAKGYRQGAVVSKTIDLRAIGSDTLRVERLGGPIRADIDWDNDDFFWWDTDNQIAPDKLTLPGDVQIRVRRSEDGQFRLIQNVRARGSNSAEASTIAEQIDYQLQLEGNTLRVPLTYNLTQGQRWRGQRIHLILEMPVGKCVVFDDKIYHHAAADLDEYAERNGRDYISRTPNRVYRMSNNGLVCADCPQWGDRNFREDRNFEEFILEGNFTTEMRRGDDFSVEVDGSGDDKALLKSIRTGGKMTLTTEGKTLSGPVRVTITTPVFTSLYARNAGDITLRGFDEGRASISVRGDSNVRGYFDSNELDVSLIGKCTLDLTGSGNHLNATLSEGAALEAGAYRVDNVFISAHENARARVHAKTSANIKNDASSNVKVDGSASSIQRDEN